MMLRRRMPAALFGAALIALALSAVGGDSGPNFGDPLPGLNADQFNRFQIGLAAFQETEGTDEGLGPVFNDISCVNCHNQTATGGGSITLETRFGRVTNGVFDPLVQFGGSLIQKQGIGQFGDANFVGEVVPAVANVVARRRAVPLFGLGLVDAVPDAQFQDLVQYQQANLPATAGRANVVLDVASGQQRVGRFGWKCQIGSLATFAGDAYVNEMGITTPMFPDENCPQGDCSELEDSPALTNPNNLTNATLVKFTDFMTFLGAPPSVALTSDTEAGRDVFVQIGCANCHVPQLQTGPNPVAALDRVTFFPFSDFLLHDMGSLGDGIAQAGAGQREMRTAPLWGVRVLTRFLHDGRATSLAGAILAHDGQGTAARDRFAGLDDDDRDNLIAFLNSL